VQSDDEWKFDPWKRGLTEIEKFAELIYNMQKAWIMEGNWDRITSYFKVFLFLLGFHFVI
jgi:hypothetical protein